MTLFKDAKPQPSSNLRPRFENAAVSVLDAHGQVREILQPLTLNLHERRIALIGANGSGKSTVLRLLNALVLPTSGRVFIDEQDTSKNAARIRRRIGFVFTDPDAQLVMPTPVEDISLSLRKAGVPRAQRAAVSEQILEDFGLKSQAHVPVHQLSGGQKQLLALAGVLATKPELVVCDEPTTLLDLRHSQKMTRLLLNLPQQLIYATHDLELAARADRVLVIEDGALAFDGPPPLAIDFYREQMVIEGSF